MSATRAATFCAPTAGVVTTSISVCGSRRDSAIWMSPVPGRHVDQQVVEVAPADVDEELLERLGEDQAAPHERGVLVVDEQAHRHDAQHARRRPCTSFGAILPLPSAALAPASRPFTPSMRGIEKPQMSASSTPTVRPRAASAAARFAVIDDLPTPPLPLPTAMTRVVGGTSVVGRRLRGAQAGLLHERRALVLGHLVVLDA